MKRFLALLVLVLVLLAGTAGMALALTLTFEVGSPELSPGQLPETSYIPPSGSPIASVTNVNWHDVGGDYGGHLYCRSTTDANIISFTSPTYVNKFEMTGLPWENVDARGYTFGPMNIAAFNATDVVPVWSTTVNFLTPPLGEDPEWYSTAYNWLTVDVNTADVSKIIFYGPHITYGVDFAPSIDNLVINEAAAVPIPASALLLASGLLALAGLRRKFSR